MKRYVPVGKLPKNPAKKISINIPRPQGPSRPLAAYRPQYYGWYDFPSPADIEKGQKILVGIGIFLAVISSEVFGSIISFQTALTIVFILSGGLALLANWRMARFQGIMMWVCTVVLALFLFMNPPVN